MATRPQITDDWAYTPPKKKLSAVVADEDWEYSPPGDVDLPGGTSKLRALVAAAEPGKEGWPEPTEFERERDPTTQEGFGTTAWRSLKNLVKGIPQLPVTLARMGTTRGMAELVAQTAEETAERRRMGRSLPYTIGAGLSSLVGVNAPAMERAADIGNAPAIYGEAAAPTALAFAPAIGRTGLRAGAATGRAIAHPIEAGRGLFESGARGLTRYVSAEKQLLRAAQPGVNIPRAPESVKIAGPEMQRVREAAGLEIRGEEAVPKAARLAELTEKDIWNNEMMPRLRAAGTLEADTKAVAAAIRSKITPRMRETSPALAKSFERTAKFYEKNLPLEEIEGYIESANQELKGFYKSTDPRLTSGTAGKLAEVRALRKVLNDTLDQATGPGTAEIKQRWGAVRDMRKSLDRQVIVQARQKGVSLYEGLGMLGAGADLASAVLTFNTLPMKGAGAYLVGRSLARARDASFQLEQAFHGRNAFAPSSPSPFQMPVRRALPAGPILAPGTSGTPLEPFTPYVAEGTRASRLGLLLKEVELPGNRSTRPISQARAAIAEAPPIPPAKMAEGMDFEVNRLARAIREEGPSRPPEEVTAAEARLAELRTMRDELQAEPSPELPKSTRQRRRRRSLRELIEEE